MGKKKMYEKFLLGNLMWRDYLGHLSVYGRIILKF